MIQYVGLLLLNIVGHHEQAAQTQPFKTLIMDAGQALKCPLSSCDERNAEDM